MKEMVKLMDNHKLMLNRLAMFIIVLFVGSESRVQDISRTGFEEC